MNLVTFLLLFAAIGLGVAGQLLLKHGMAKRPNIGLSELRQIAFDIHVVGGFSSYGISVLLYFKVLEVLDLSVAYPTVSLGYVLIILLSRILFKEIVTPTRWAAVVIICAGVVLVGLGA